MGDRVKGANRANLNPNAGGTVQPRVRNPAPADVAGPRRKVVRRKGEREQSPAHSGGAAESHGLHLPGGPPESGMIDLAVAPNAGRPTYEELLRFHELHKGAAPAAVAPATLAAPDVPGPRAPTIPPVRTGDRTLERAGIPDTPLSRPTRLLGDPRAQASTLLDPINSYRELGAAEKSRISCIARHALRPTGMHTGARLGRAAGGQRNLSLGLQFICRAPWRAGRVRDPALWCLTRCEAVRIVLAPLRSATCWAICWQIVLFYFPLSSLAPVAPHVRQGLSCRGAACSNVPRLVAAASNLSPEFFFLPL